jgi:hypothetical protein
MSPPARTGHHTEMAVYRRTAMPVYRSVMRGLDPRLFFDLLNEISFSLPVPWENATEYRAR